MARARGKVVQTVVYAPTGDTAEIRLFQNPLRFQVEIGRDHFEDPDGEAVAEWAREKLKRNATMAWFPVVELYVSPGPRPRNTSFRSRAGEDAAAAECSFEYRRYHLARVSAEGASPRFSMLPWHLYDAASGSGPVEQATTFNLLSRSGLSMPDGFDGTLPFVDRGERGIMPHEPRESDELRALLPYDEATWAGIVAVADMLTRARARLMEIAASPEKLGAIAGAVGGLLSLGAPAPKAP